MFRGSCGWLLARAVAGVPFVEWICKISSPIQKEIKKELHRACRKRKKSGTGSLIISWITPNRSDLNKYASFLPSNRSSRLPTTTKNAQKHQERMQCEARLHISNRTLLQTLLTALWRCCCWGTSSGWRSASAPGRRTRGDSLQAHLSAEYFQTNSHPRSRNLRRLRRRSGHQRSGASCSKNERTRTISSAPRQHFAGKLGCHSVTCSRVSSETGWVSLILSPSSVQEMNHVKPLTLSLSRCKPSIGSWTNLLTDYIGKWSREY